MAVAAAVALVGAGVGTANAVTTSSDSTGGQYPIFWCNRSASADGSVLGYTMSLGGTKAVLAPGRGDDSCRTLWAVDGQPFDIIATGTNGQTFQHRFVFDSSKMETTYEVFAGVGRFVDNDVAFNAEYPLGMETVRP